MGQQGYSKLYFNGFVGLIVYNDVALPHCPMVRKVIK